MQPFRAELFDPIGPDGKLGVLTKGDTPLLVIVDQSVAMKPPLPRLSHNLIWLGAGDNEHWVNISMVSVLANCLSAHFAATQSVIADDCRSEAGGWVWLENCRSLVG
jgi:hypothetical protein